jgi:release factor glutamine methyltransferase
MVYSPREDSYLLESAVKKVAAGRFLDLGCGSGIQGLAAAEKGCRVTCSDADAEAVEAARKEFAERGLKAEFVVGDLFEGVDGAFDCIAFNPPYLPGDKGHSDLDGGEKGLCTTKRFLKRVNAHLAEGGVVLLVATSLCGQDEELKKLLLDEGFKVSVEGTQSFFFEKLCVLKAVKK